MKMIKLIFFFIICMPFFLYKKRVARNSINRMPTWRMFKIEVLRSHELMTALILINVNFIRKTSQENYLCPSGFAVC